MGYFWGAACVAYAAYAGTVVWRAGRPDIVVGYAAFAFVMWVAVKAIP